MATEKNRDSILDDAAVLLQAGQLDAAEGCYHQLLSILPDHPRAMQGLGIVLFQKGFHDKGMHLLRSVISVNPDFSAAWLNLSIMLKETGQLDDAQVFSQAAALNPGSSIAQYNYGWLLFRQRNFVDAAVCFQKSLNLQDDYLDAALLLGVTYAELADFNKAISVYSKITESYPGMASAWCNLGYYLFESGELHSAQRALAKSLKCDAGLAETWNNIGNLKLAFGKVGSTIRAFKKAIAINPNFVAAHSNLLLAMHYIDGQSPAAILSESICWSDVHGSKVEHYSPNNNVLRGKEQRIRVGIVSADYRAHPVSMFLEPFLLEYDRNKLEIFCYADVSHPDDVTKRLSCISDHWISVAGMSHDDISGRIKSDQIQVLFDIGGHTNGDLLRVFSSKPAPIQVSWLGYPGTTGLSNIDFRLTDEISDPHNLTDCHYTEKLIRMPGGFLCYAPPSDTPSIDSASVEKNGNFTFGCFNNFAKINNSVIKAWIAILERVPGSKLLIKNRSVGDDNFRLFVKKRFKLLGGDPASLLMIGQTSSFADHLNTYNEVDVALDTFPYNGTTTTCEALLMGVPVITLAGDMHVARVSASILGSLGMECCVASTVEEYISLACRLASGDKYLGISRNELRTRFLSSSVCDAKRFAREMERVIQSMWSKNCKTNGYVQINENTPFENHSIGLDFLSSKKYVDAEKRFRDALSCKDDFAAAWSDLGISVFSQGRKYESLDYFKRAVELDSGYAKGWSNLGNALRECGYAEEAVIACKTALELQPELSEARNNLGVSLMSLGKHKEAVECLLEATKFDAKSPLVWSNAADASHEVGLPYQAISCYRQVLKLEPDNAAVYAKLGAVFLGLAEHDQAEKLFRKALSIEKDDPYTHSAILMSFQYLLTVSQAEIHSESLRWSQKYGVSIPWCGKIKSDVSRKIRVGYVSADFRRHPVGTFLMPLLSNHDRERFSVYLYSNDFREDQLTSEFKQCCDGWRVIAGLSDRNALELIQKDEIDILVDLSGHTAGNRLPLFARKPAPVQASFLGYCHTTGMDSIDYILSDSDTIIHEEEHFYSERIVYLPYSRFCYQAPEFIPDVDVLPAIENKRITFGSFNNLAKINETVIDLWSKVLLAVPDSRLILKWKSFASGHVKRKFINIFSKHNIESSRIEFRDSSPHFFMMAEYGDVDIVLDSFPFTGGTTTCEALWMGVPVITMSGNTPISRQSASFLKLIGLPEFIAESYESYVQVAVKAAADISRLSEIRASLRERMVASSLCDAKRYAEDVETAFLKMWRETSNSQLPEDDVTAIITSAFESASSFYSKGLLERAENIYLDIIRWKPENSRSLNGLGMIANKRGYRDDGISYLQKAVEFKPDYADAHFNLGNLLKASDRLTDSESSFRNVINLNPENAAAYANLGGSLWAQGKIDEAINIFQQSLERSPEFDVAFTGLLLSMNYTQNQTPEDIFEAHLKWGKLIENKTKAFNRWENKREPNKVLTIGYVSPDLGIHPVGFFMVKPIQYRTPNKYQVICYSNRTGDDELTSYFKQKVDKWRDIHGLDDDKVCKMIRNDRVDILVDLSGHTGGNRLSLFARQPAPVQVTWLGYPNTTGLSRIHYRLTDAIVDPPGNTDSLHTEKLFRLSSGFLCYYPPSDAPQVGLLPFYKNGYVTFGSFNNLAKITSEVISVWSRIMNNIPGSRFIMKRSSFRDAQTVSRFLDMFTDNGVDASRVDLIPSTETHSKHLEIYSSVDIALDSFPYNGTTTTCEALWMGVPVIVLAGDRHAGRVGMSILNRVGLDEFIARDVDDYVAITTNLSNDIDKLSQIHDFLRDRMQSSPICNGPGFCLALENAYREMWKKFCRSSGTDFAAKSRIEQKATGVRRLHIGGNIAKKGWEIFNALSADIVDHLGDAADLSRFEDNTFHEIYASHVLEHFDYNFQLKPVLMEWARVLVPGGSLYISVPDLDRFMEMWVDYEHTSDEERLFIMQMIFGGHTDNFDYHYVGFNEKILTNFLTQTGFSEIIRVDGFNLFKDSSTMTFKGKPVSLNIIAKKAITEKC